MGKSTCLYLVLPNTSFIIYWAKVSPALCGFRSGDGQLVATLVVQHKLRLFKLSNPELLGLACLALPGPSPEAVLASLLTDPGTQVLFVWRGVLPPLGSSKQ
jgi:hypothetical protein